MSKQNKNDNFTADQSCYGVPRIVFFTLSEAVAQEGKIVKWLAFAKGEYTKVEEEI